MSKYNKNYIVKLLEYGLSSKHYEMINTKNIIIKYNGGGKWNPHFSGTWYDLYIPIKLPTHKILNKNDMKKDESKPYYVYSEFDQLINSVNSLLEKQFDVEEEITISVKNNQFFVEFCLMLY